MNLSAQFGRQMFPSGPIVFGQAVFDGDDGELPHPVGPELRHLFRGARGLVGLLEDVFAARLVVEFAGRGIERDGDVLAGLVACRRDGFENDLDGLFVRFQVGREAAFVAHRRGIAALVQHGLQAVKDFDAHAQGFVERLCADGHGHEFLQVHGIVGVRAAVENVHHRHGEHVAGRIARIAREIFVERLARRRGRRARRGHRDGEDGVRAEIALVRRAVGFDHAAVERALVGGIEPGDRAGQRAVHVGDGFEHALAEIARFVAVAQFDGFVLAGGCAGRHRGAAQRAAFQNDIRLDRGIAARIDDLPAVHARDFRRHAASEK